MSDSIYRKKRGEFKQFIQGLDKTMTVRDVIGEWREFKNLSKDFKDMSIQQLTDSNLIAELYTALREGMGPETKFPLPYNREDRKREIIDNIAQSYSIDKDKAKSDIVTDSHDGGKDGRIFPYCLEVVIAPYEGYDRSLDGAGSIDIIGSINDTPSIDGGSNYFDGNYAWYNKKKDKFDRAFDLRGILHECGFNTSDSFSKRRVQCVLYINLLTPCPEWLGGAGKTHIDTIPYADNIAKTVSSLAYKMPSYYGKISTSSRSYSQKEKSGISYLEDFLRQRKEEVDADPSIEEITQSGVWYRIRPELIEGGYEPKGTWGETRNYITANIDKTCRELFGDNVEREDLGIVAKARGMMLYNGNVYPISVDTIKTLGRKGVFILVIEKEGIADIFEDVARNSGIALVHTGGKFTKYVKLFIEQAEIPIAILTDYDYDGIKMCAELLSEKPRIGINMDIIEWLQQNGHTDLTREQVEEENTPRVQPQDEYLKHHRIELDSIHVAVGTESFWKYIKFKIEELQKDKGFNYNNVIDNPEVNVLYPEAMNDLASKIEAYIEKITKEEEDKIFEEQEAVKELISVEDKKFDNTSRLKNIVSEDDELQKKIVPIFEKLNEELSKILVDGLEDTKP